MFSIPGPRSTTQYAEILASKSLTLFSFPSQLAGFILAFRFTHSYNI